MGAKVLQVATKLGLFTALADGPLTADGIRARLGLHPRAVPDFPDALVALGMLARDGDGPEARYANTPETARFLVRGREEYAGGILEMYDVRLFRFWADLETALRSGQPQNEVKHTGTAMFDELYRDPARLEQFMAAMSGISRPNFVALAERFDFGPYRTLCDVGGAAADLSCAVAARHPHLRCTSFDLPVVEPIARAAIARRGLADRVTTAVGDFFRDPLPRADVVTMGMILHDWNLEKKKHLIRAVYDALPPDGAFIAVENLIDDARRENAFGLLMSLNMLIEFGDAFDYTGNDFRGWCAEAGFRRFAVVALGGPASAAVATSSGASAAPAPAHDRGGVGLRPLESDQVAGAFDRARADRAAERVGEALRVAPGDHAVVAAPDEERRRLDAQEPFLEAELGDGEEELGGSPESPRHRDEELDLLLRAVVLLAEERRHAEHALRGVTALVVEEVRDELVRHHPEHVGDGRLVAPEADRGCQREAADLLRTERSHFGRHPAPHRFADDVRALEPERLEEVEPVEEEVPLVFERVDPGRLSKPGRRGA
jgi:hypothetical protein